MPHALKYYVASRVLSLISQVPGQNKKLSTSQTRTSIYFITLTALGTLYPPPVIYLRKSMPIRVRTCWKNLTFPIISLAKGRTFRWSAKTPCSIPFGVGLLLVWLWSGTISGLKQSIARISVLQFVRKSQLCHYITKSLSMSLSLSPNPLGQLSERTHMSTTALQCPEGAEIKSQSLTHLINDWEIV